MITIGSGACGGWRVAAALIRAACWIADVALIPVGSSAGGRSVALISVVGGIIIIVIVAGAGGCDVVIALI